MIEVLWIDDECITNLGKLSPMGEEFVNYAYEQKIKITPMQTYKEGIGAIRNNPNKWCAVILDIHNQKATSGKPSDDFDAARDEIKSIQTLNHQKEPYIFILSGNKLYHGEHSTIRKPDYCSKSIYDKNGENYKQLFEDILKIQSVSKLYTCQEQYKDVLTIANDFCGEETWQRLFNVLYKITINDVKNNPALFNEMRKILEDIMKVLERYRYSYFAATKEEISLNNLSRYIGNDINVPGYIQRAFHTLTNVTQNGSHRLEVDSDVSCSKAPYLLRSCLYDLCNILIWIRDLA